MYFSTWRVKAALNSTTDFSYLHRPLLYLMTDYRVFILYFPLMEISSFSKCNEGQLPYILKMFVISFVCLCSRYLLGIICR